jgi:Mg2+ and Co2+ transporter CorA
MIEETIQLPHHYQLEKDLLDRYSHAIDKNEEDLEITESTQRVFQVLRHAGHLSRSTRHIAEALDEALSKVPDERKIRDLRDRAHELERASELLQTDARETLSFWQAESAEEQAKSSRRLGRILFKLNLLIGFFLPLVALGGLFGMNVNLPTFTKDLFWLIFLGGLLIGGAILLFISREREK